MCMVPVPAWRCVAVRDGARVQVEAKNSLESYIYNMRNTLRNDKLRDQLSEEDQATVEKAVEDVIHWLDGNQ